MGEKETPRWPVPVAVAAMIGLTIWLLVQMAPDGPEHGANLIRIAVGLAIFLVAGAIAFGPAALRRRKR